MSQGAILEDFATDSFNYTDRRMFYLPSPRYRLPHTLFKADEFSLKFILLYSADFVGLPPVPDAATLPPTSSNQPYAALSTQPEFISSISPVSEDLECLIPSFPYLFRSEIHVIRLHTQIGEVTRGNHKDQLVELIASRNYDRASTERLLDASAIKFINSVILDMPHKSKAGGFWKKLWGSHLSLRVHGLDQLLQRPGREVLEDSSTPVAVRKEYSHPIPARRHRPLRLKPSSVSTI